MTTLVHVGDGRHIELEEGLYKPAPPPKPKPVRRDRCWPRKRKVVAPNKSARAATAHAGMKAALAIPGFTEWKERRRVAAQALQPQDGKIAGQVAGKRKCTVKRLMAQAREQARIDMENIKREVPDLDPRAEEALEEACGVLRGTGNASTKLAAARLILDFTKAKPASSSKVTIKTAEDWLQSIAEPDDTSRD